MAYETGLRNLWPGVHCILVDREYLLANISKLSDKNGV